MPVYMLIARTCMWAYIFLELMLTYVCTLVDGRGCVQVCLLEAAIYRL